MTRQVVGLLAPRVHGVTVRWWALVRLTRPWFWPLGWGGAYLGQVLATRSWFPPASSTVDTLVAAVVLGPLVWGAVLAVNDRHDLASDRRNPRKATAPLVTGILSVDDLHRWGLLWMVAAVLAALTISPAFAVGTALVLVLGWLYSAPPWRLKARAGFDVAVNALVIGVLGPLAGWILHRPAGDYPTIMLLLGLLVAGALYIPTTVMDVEADRSAGDLTSAVRWTPKVCNRIGLGLWIAAVAVWLLCCHSGWLVVRDGWLLQDLTAPALVAVYLLMTRRPSIARMAVVSITFAVPALDFLAAYVRYPTG